MWNIDSGIERCLKDSPSSCRLNVASIYIELDCFQSSLLLHINLYSAENRYLRVVVDRTLSLLNVRIIIAAE